MLSIIVRTKNEERWIAPCLKAIFEQSYKDFEVIIVDNCSTDGTVVKAKQYPVKIVTIEDYLPGKSLNVGIEASKGEYLVFLSGHCIPTNGDWLQNLINAFTEDDIAGVYGRQEPMNFSSPQTKRDLLIVFGLDRRVQVEDPFFHNANAIIRRDIWEKYPFDSVVTNIEDRLWASTVQNESYKIVYEPKASVYHHHGIHHDGDTQRAHTTVKVIEGFANSLLDYNPGEVNAEKFHTVAFIPVKGQGPLLGDKKILKFTLRQAQESKYVKDVFILTDSQETADFAAEFDVKVPFIRPKELSGPNVSLDTVYEYSLAKIEALGIHPDLIITLWPSFPFRPKGLIDSLISNLLRDGYDSMVPGHDAYDSFWIHKEEEYRRLDMGDVPRNLKSPILIGLNGLGCVTHSEYIRKGRLLGDNVGLMKVTDPLAAVVIREDGVGEKKLEELLFNPKNALY